MKRIVKLSLIVLFIMGIMMHAYAAITGTVNLSTGKAQYNKDEQIVVEVKLSNLKSDRGIIALGAILEYDKNNLEYVGMEGKNGWSTPFYNPSNGKLTTDRNGFATNDETMFQITFKVKSQNAKNIGISLKNVEVADGNQQVILPSNAVTINKATTPDVNPNPNPDTNTNTNTNNNNTQKPNNTSGTNTNKNTSTNKIAVGDNVANNKLPNTGSNNIIIIALVGIAVVCGIVFFIRMKRLSSIK